MFHPAADTGVARTSRASPFPRESGPAAVHAQASGARLIHALTRRPDDYQVEGCPTLWARPRLRLYSTSRNALAAKVGELPEQLRRSLTWDQGKEMAAHAQFSVKTGVPVYFCDPRSPWQGGSKRTPTASSASTSPSEPGSRTTPKPNSTPSPPNSTEGLDKPSASRHHQKHSTKRCDEPLNPQPISSASFNRTTVARVGLGILAFFIFVLSAVVLAVGFGVELCRGVRRQRRDASSGAPTA